MNIHGTSVLVLVLALTAACGHRGPLVPPLPRLPSRPEEPRWRQRGDQLEVEASYSLTLVSSRPLKPPMERVLLALSLPTAEAAAPYLTPRRDREFLEVSKAYAIGSFDLQTASGSAVPRRLWRDRMPTAEFGSANAAVLAVALRDARDLSLPSARTLWLPAHPPLVAPTNLVAHPRAEGIELTWDPPVEPRAQMLQLYRHRDTVAEPWAPWKTVPNSASSWLDDAVQFGETWIYTVTTAAGSGGIPIESIPVTTGPVPYLDRFPPKPPRDLDVFVEQGAIRVIWTSGGSSDEHQVRIEREVDGGERFESVGVVASADTTFVDRSVAAGRRVRYRLIASDENGNAADPTAPSGWVEMKPAHP